MMGRVVPSILTDEQCRNVKIRHWAVGAVWWRIRSHKVRCNQGDGTSPNGKQIGPRYRHTIQVVPITTDEQCNNEAPIFKDW